MKILPIIIFILLCFKSPVSAQTTSDDYNNYGLNESEKLNYKKAVVYFTKAIELDPKSETPLYNRGLAYFALENYTASIADFTKLIQLNSKKDEYYYNRALCYRELKKYEDAISD